MNKCYFGEDGAFNTNITIDWTENTTTIALKAKWEITSCAKGKYLENNECKPCDSGYTSNGGTVTHCTKNCESKDITNCKIIEGIIKKGSSEEDKTGCKCKACKTGYNLSENSCTAKTTNITLDNNGGEGGTDHITATYGQPMQGITSLPTRTGYNFTGYYENENCSSTNNTKYYNSNGTSANNWDKTDETATLYACWSIKNNITCQKLGQYLPANSENCNDCPEGSYCPNNTNKNYTFSTANQGIVACPSPFSNSDQGTTSENDCYRSCVIGDILNCKSIAGNITKGETKKCTCTTCNAGYKLSSGTICTKCTNSTNNYNQYCDGTDTLQNCDEGKKANSDFNGCEDIKCINGQIPNSNGQCTPCTSDHWCAGGELSNNTYTSQEMKKYCEEKSKSGNWDSAKGCKCPVGMSTSTVGSKTITNCKYTKDTKFCFPTPVEGKIKCFKISDLDTGTNGTYDPSWKVVYE